LDLLLSLFPDETEKWQSRFQRERKAKEADCIIAEKLPRRGILGFCLSSHRGVGPSPPAWKPYGLEARPEAGKAKNPENLVDPV